MFIAESRSRQLGRLIRRLFSDTVSVLQPVIRRDELMARFQILTTTGMKIGFFWRAALCDLEEIDRR